MDDYSVDVTPPDAPSSTKYSKFETNNYALIWGDPADADFSHCELKRVIDTVTTYLVKDGSNLPAWASSGTEWTFAENDATKDTSWSNYIDESVSGTTIAYYVRSLDLTGNGSAWTLFSLGSLGISTPTLTIDGDIATIADAETTYLNMLMYKVQGTNVWYTYSYITGNGTITISGLAAGNYTMRVMSIGSPGTVSDSVSYVVSGTTTVNTINTNWSRWIFASICQHFDDNKGTLPLYIEGQYISTPRPNNFMELRIDGPYYTHVNKKDWKVYLEVNVLLQSSINDADFHNQQRYLGLISTIFSCIKLYKYGTGAMDDDSQFGCLFLLQDTQARERLQISNFGRVDVGSKLEQATIEGHYKTNLTV